MRVAIEADYSGAGVRGGTHYFNHLIEELGRLSPEDEFLVFGFFYHDFERKIRQVRMPESPNVRMAVQRWPQSLVKRLEWGWKLPLIECYLAARGVDAYHCFRPPTWSAKRLVMLQPDIAPLTHPHWYAADARAVWEEMTRPGLERCARIMTYCEATRRDLVRHLRIPEERIRVTRLGVDHALFKPGISLEAARVAGAKFSLPERFLLMVGPFDVLTHFKTVVEALRLWKGVSEPAPIVAVGPVDDYVRGLQKMAEEGGVSRYFHWAGYIPHAELADVYRLADGLLYPSRLPGVELPPYEAMACGAPVVTSLDENVAEAGIVIDAESPSQLYEAARRVWESPALRAELSAKGLARAAQFTWERCARETLAVYREIAGA